MWNNETSTMLNSLLPGYQLLSPLPFGLITCTLGRTHMDHHNSNQITINTRVTGSNFAMTELRSGLGSANLSLMLCCVALRGCMLNVIIFAPTATQLKTGSSTDEKFPSSSNTKQALHPTWSSRAALNLRWTCRLYSTHKSKASLKPLLDTNPSSHPHTCPPRIRQDWPLPFILLLKLACSNILDYQPLCVLCSSHFLEG